MYRSNGDLTNTPGIYYALAYGLSAFLYVWLNRHKEPFRRRLFVFFGLWAFMGVFMTLTNLVPQAWFISCMLVDVGLIFLMIFSSCSIPILNTVYFTAQAFIMGEFAASLEWQLFYYGLTELGIPLRLWTNLLFLVVCHGSVFGILYKLERRFQESNESLVITKRHLLPVFSVTVIAFALSNISYVLKNTPFSGQLTEEIFTIHTLTDLGGLAILFSYRMVIQEALRQKEIDSLQHVVEQQYENYRVTEESIDLVNRKYHDLKHQITYLKSGVSDGERLVSVSIGQHKGFLRIRVENRYEGEIRFRNGLPAETSKEDKNFHGYGIKSMKMITDRHGGSMQTDAGDGWFRLSVLIPTP